MYTLTRCPYMFYDGNSPLLTGSTRVVMAVGEASGGQMAYRGGVGLAQRLGTEVVVFPGDHGGFSTHPDEFAAMLHQVLVAG
jgi:hypothetical protein